GTRRHRAGSQTPLRNDDRIFRKEREIAALFAVAARVAASPTTPASPTAATKPTTTATARHGTRNRAGRRTRYRAYGTTRRRDRAGESATRSRYRGVRA